MEQSQYASDPIITGKTYSGMVNKVKVPAWIHALGRMSGVFQVVLDGCVVLGTYLLSYWIYTSALERSPPQSLPVFLVFALGVAVLHLLIFDLVGLYEKDASLLNIRELTGVFKAGLYGAAVVLSVSFYLRTTSFSRITLTTALVCTPFVLYMERRLFHRFLLFLQAKGWARKRVLIFGAGEIGTQLAKRMQESPALGMVPLAFLDDDSSKWGSELRWIGMDQQRSLRVLGGEDVLGKLKDLQIQKVIIALPSASFERNQRLVSFCANNGIEYSIVPNSYEKFIQDIQMYDINGIPLLKRKDHQVKGYYLFCKRVIDFLMAALLTICLSPLLIIFALLIRWDSSGPVIFKQKRVGQGGREFSFYKFRTMYVDAPKYARSPADPRDARITNIGRILRRTSLDELPQIFNILRGDMSFVGPRPEMPFIVAGYTALQRRRLEAKPGITGVWQISAARSEPIHFNIEYDLFYLQNRSLLLDLAIVLKTVTSVIRGIGAV